jgi:hypothetical protein
MSSDLYRIGKEKEVSSIDWNLPDHEWNNEMTLLLVVDEENKLEERKRAVRHLNECQKWYEFD